MTIFEVYNKIKAVIFTLLCLFFSKQCTSDYIKGADKTAIANYEKMIFDNSVTDAELDPTYKEVTIKIMKVPIKTYEFKYHFNIDGTSYQGDHTFNELPESDNIQVYYLKNDPKVNTVNPAEKLKSEKEKMATNKDLYWGIGWGIIGLLSLISLISKMRQR